MVLHAEFPAGMKSQLNDLPKSPSDSYIKGLERIRNAAEFPMKAALHALAWIHYAKGKLRMKQLLDAVAWTTNTTDYKLEAIDLMAMCRGLAIYDKVSGIVRFIHGTVETFLTQYFDLEGIKYSAVVTHDIIEVLRPHFLSNIDLAKACLTYLSLDIFNNPCPDGKSLRERMKKHEFSCYAA
jgi:hypothetical protein